MAFRRQDIPKTTRKGADGESRRVYPRFAKDRSLLPKVDLAIGYLDSMVGRRRGDLAADTVVELFGDPKLARCMVTALSESYRYRTPSFRDILGDETAATLAGWDILTAPDLRGHLYLAANARMQGVVATSDRAPLLAEIAAPLGLEAGRMDELLHLDAERNAILVRVGPRPRAEDMVARYNVLLALSVLRHAATINLCLPGLTLSTVETVCSRHDVAVRGGPSETWQLSGRRNALGSFVSFGARLARCALHLILLCPEVPSGDATVHLGDRVLQWVFDPFAMSVLHPRSRVAAPPDGIIRTTVLSERWAALRRKEGGLDAWRVSRAAEPIVTSDAVVLPELLFTRDDTVVALVAGPVEESGRPWQTALSEIAVTRPLVAVGAAVDGVTSLATPDATTLLTLLDELDAGSDLATTPVRLLQAEVIRHGWVGRRRIEEVLGVTAESEVSARLRLLTVEGEVALVGGFGLCRVSLLDDLLDRIGIGPVDISAARLAVAAAVGEGPAADALTLHLLGQTAVIRPSHPAAAA